MTKRPGKPVQAYVNEQDLAILKVAGVSISELIRRAISTEAQRLRKKIPESL